ncbi:MAG: hypothetical protein WC943_02425 [Elusimicrobiota bacterium]
MRTPLPIAFLLATGLMPAQASAEARQCAAPPRLQSWGGAYFRKVVSLPQAEASGIAAEGVLPSFLADPARYFTPADPKLEHQIGPLDRASVYLGGNGGGKELDVGVNWRRVYDRAKRPAFTDKASACDNGDLKRRFFMSRSKGVLALEDGTGAVVASGEAAVAAAMARMIPDFAFQPFWRTTNNGGNQWNQPDLGSPENLLLYPGEAFFMRLEQVRGSTFTISIAVRPPKPGRQFSVTFRQEGFEAAGRVFKRADSIDQYVLIDGVRKGNEKPDGSQIVIPTKARALGMRWERVSVLGPKGRLIPMAGDGCVEVRGHDTAPAYDRVFKIKGFTPEGGESVDILPSAMAPLPDHTSVFSVGPSPLADGAGRFITTWPSLRAWGRAVAVEIE